MVQLLKCAETERDVRRNFSRINEIQRNSEKELLIDTRAGIKKVLCNSDESFSVNMGAPVFSREGILDFPKILLF